MVMIPVFIILFILYFILEYFLNKNMIVDKNSKNKNKTNIVDKINALIENKDLKIVDAVKFDKINIQLYEADKRLQGNIWYSIHQYIVVNEDGEITVGDNMPQTIYIDLMRALTNFNFVAFSAGLGFNDDGSFKLLDIENDMMNKINEHLNNEIGRIIVDFHTAVIEEKVEELLDSLFPNFDRDGNMIIEKEKSK